jgi:hypothetical protein
LITICLGFAAKPSLFRINSPQAASEIERFNPLFGYFFLSKKYYQLIVKFYSATTHHSRYIQIF